MKRNPKKTKDMFVRFLANPTSPSPPVIGGDTIEKVKEIKLQFDYRWPEVEESCQLTKPI